MMVVVAEFTHYVALNPAPHYNTYYAYATLYEHWIAKIGLLSFLSFLFLAKMAVSDVSQKYDVIIRIFEILKYQNILALTVWPIVPITF